MLFAMRFAILFCAAAFQMLAAGMPVRGLHLSAPKPGDIPLVVRFITEALPKEGVNTLVLEINYQYKFEKRPEVADSDALSRDDVKQIVAACRRAGVRLIPQVNCLGHQSWAKTTFGLLRSHPEFDETPGKYPDNKDIYCRSYCPLHPKVHEVLFDVMDEIADVFETDAFHVGMDEVFLLADKDCPRCRGKLTADLIAGEVRTLHDHLARSNREMWIWGDRFLDGATTGVGEWEGSMNQTYPSIHNVPKDIVICDWHYDAPVSTAALFANEGFPVVSSPWRDTKVAMGEFEIMRALAAYSNEPVRVRARGMLQTTWMNPAEFIRAYNGEEGVRPQAKEAANCFRVLFEAIRKAGQ